MISAINLHRKIAIFLSIIAVFMLGGCVATMGQQVLDSEGKGQLQKRSYQTRTFDTVDKEKVLRAVIATLQDLGFVIDKADSMLGSVSATKLDTYNLRITVSVRPRAEVMLVRANAQFHTSPVEDPKPYQDFFNSLSKSLFLQAQNVD